MPTFLTTDPICCIKSFWDLNRLCLVGKIEQQSVVIVIKALTYIGAEGITF